MGRARFATGQERDITMDDISELERRIAAALERIGAGLEPGRGAAGTASPPSDGDDTRIAELQEALDAERTANAQLNERVKAIRDRQETTVAGLERKLDQATRQLDAQGLEVQRLKKVNVGLREALRSLQEAQAAGVPDPHLINKAMLAELEALRAARTAEMAEMDEILKELTPLVEEESHA